MDTWILQAGYPVVTVDRNYESGLTSFSQERFLLYKHTTKMGNSSRWWVPITYTSQYNPDFTNTRPSFWLNPTEEQPYSMLQSPGEKWIIVNIQETGYYRVNYDARNWKLLTDQLRSQAGAKEQVIPPSARSQLLDDAFNLARSGLLPYSTALDLCLTLRNDTDYLPWASTYRALSFLDEMLTNSPIYEEFKKSNEKKEIQSLNRDYALRMSCHWGDEKCIDEAKKRFSQWKESFETDSDSNYW
ncbi:hypothetical protein J437_LFUL015484 [Ladona fulva]|uniref:ERAP1-like C-terminal domain-containing protein n=1 Tax=Ladona fulva TaxID=123851 RepID=A0A8K0KJ01_LADFU|nr:hypothetical protein J437_LFUL015484 [Ladona fulva]